MAPPCAAVLLLLFNRPTLAARAVEALRPARPQRVYLAADGPRPDHPDDGQTCAAARAQALQSIDWPCEINTLFRDENLGCARAVHGAVTWFFEHEAEGIVLEDDCLATPAFFPFCTELLARFRTETRVFAVSGDNFVESHTPMRPSYWFNGVFHVWGWAGWRDRWATVPLAIEAPDQHAIRRALRHAGLSRAEIAYWAPLFNRVRRDTAPAERINSWAYPAAYHVFVNRLFCICPARNLVRNVGFGSGSTHFDGPGAGAGLSIATAELPFPLEHPRHAAVDRKLHRRNLLEHFGVRTDPMAELAAGVAGLRELMRRTVRPPGSPAR